VTPVLWMGHLVNGDLLASATWISLDTGKVRVRLEFTGGAASDFSFIDKPSALRAIKRLHNSLRMTRRG
jgi:hypothetical protein